MYIPSLHEGWKGGGPPYDILLSPKDVLEQFEGGHKRFEVWCCFQAPLRKLYFAITARGAITIEQHGRVISEESYNLIFRDKGKGRRIAVRSLIVGGNYPCLKWNELVEIPGWSIRNLFEPVHSGPINEQELIYWVVVKILLLRLHAGRKI